MPRKEIFQLICTLGTEMFASLADFSTKMGNGPRRSRPVTPMMMPRPCPAGSRLLKTFFKSKKFVYNGKMTNFRGILVQS